MGAHGEPPCIPTRTTWASEAGLESDQKSLKVSQHVSQVMTDMKTMSNNPWKTFINGAQRKTKKSKCVKILSWKEKKDSPRKGRWKKKVEPNRQGVKVLDVAERVAELNPPPFLRSPFSIVYFFNIQRQRRLLYMEIQTRTQPQRPSTTQVGKAKTAIKPYCQSWNQCWKK